jgi:hypothetical protein
MRLGKAQPNMVKTEVSRQTPILYKQKSHTLFQTTKGDFDLILFRRRTEIDAPAPMGK